MSRSGTIADLLVELQKKVNLDEDAIQHVRVFEAHGGKIYKELREDFSIAGLNEFVLLYAERIPDEELNMSKGERLISAFNFDREPGKPHGVPFKFVVKPVSDLRIIVENCLAGVSNANQREKGEIFKETKERLSKRTGIKGKQFDKIKFAVVPRVMYTKPQYLEDGKSLGLAQLACEHGPNYYHR